MKKLILILGLLLFNISLALEEDVPMFPLGSETGVYLKVPTTDGEINVDGMKRKDKVKKAEQEANSLQKPKILLDRDAINHERALNFSTKQNNALLPAF